MKIGEKVNLGNFGQVWASLGQFWAILGNFGQVWTSLDKFGRVWASQDKATNQKNGGKGRKNKKREKKLSGDGEEEKVGSRIRRKLSAN